MHRVNKILRDHAHLANLEVDTIARNTIKMTAAETRESVLIIWFHSQLWGPQRRMPSLYARAGNWAQGGFDRLGRADS